MKNSFKQLYRTPFKAVLFFLLLCASTALLTFGAMLLTRTKAQIDGAKEQFTTLATVTQKPNTVETESVWDAALQDYSNMALPQYDSIVPLEVLDIESAPYVSGPEKRPTYGALVAGLQTTCTTDPSYYTLIAEFTPQEDCVPDHAVRVNLVRMLLGNIGSSTEFPFCDHYNDNPAPLEKGKTYIAGMLMINGHSLDLSVDAGVEYAPTGGWEEATPERRQYWKSIAAGIRRLDSTIPVLPTRSLNLLSAYHENQIVLLDGREISPEEFESGKAVCMVTGEFARVNGLQVGDTLTLPLYFADYRDPPSKMFGYSGGGYETTVLLDENSELWQPFFEGQYEIVGTYRYTEESASVMPGATEMGRDMVIIPAGSVTASDENNICCRGPMQATTTSFQLENGTAAQFEEALRKLPESQFLQVDYDDNGYEQIVGSLNRVYGAAVLLCGAGGFCAAAIVALLLYFFIVKQKKRTAIERSLGMSRAQCRVSLLAGIFALTVCACILGGLCSRVIFERVQIGGANESITFSTKYSTWAEGEDMPEVETDGEALLPAVGIPLILTAFTIAIGLALVEGNLRVEPVRLLGGREE